MLQVKPSPSVEEAKGELASVLASNLFVRSPQLSRLLEYLCSKYLDGDREEVKEYQIGVEVLGRPSTFDPAEDAGARVEAYRLRKRLKEFYETDGRDHTLRIDVPLGHYTVVFSHVIPPATIPTNGLNHGPQEEAPASNSPLVEPDSPPLVIDPPKRSPSSYRLAIVAAGVVALTLAGFLILRSRASTSTALPPAVRLSQPNAAAVSGTARVPPPALSPQNSVRIVCGRTKNHLDRWGEVWEADRDFEGGTPFQIGRQFIARAYDPKIFQAGRMGNFTYKIPLAPGVYELHLYFMEGTYGPAMPAGGGEISRIFTVLANGKPLLSRFDVYSDAGGSNIGDVRVFKDISPGPGQILTLTFQGLTGMALVSAIELTPTTPHRINPIRIVTQEGYYTDSNGAIWKPDRYYNGGQVATHAVELRGTKDPELFARERYGRFDYAIPVDKGSYRLTLYFAEEYFNGAAPQGQPATRVFDVTCNGVSLLREFELLKEATPATAIVKTFHGLSPNGQGTLLVAFSPVHDYASLYALEVVDETN